MSFPNPDINSNYYITQSAGGWSPCIEGNNQYNLRPFTGSVLPNCTGYVTGRFNEVLNEGACTYFGNYNANMYYGIGQLQGLPVGDIPIPGGVIVWDDGNEGHAAFIEEVFDNDTVETSESGWNYTGLPIVTSHIRHRVGGDFEYAPGYLYLGIVYPPGALTANDYYMLWLSNE